MQKHLKTSELKHLKRQNRVISGKEVAIRFIYNIGSHKNT